VNAGLNTGQGIEVFLAVLFCDGLFSHLRTHTACLIKYLESLHQSPIQWVPELIFLLG
jgi:hypothetical protein